MANTLKFGASEWYGSEGNILAYNDENGNFKPLPFTFSRNSLATRVNKQGLIETVQANDARVDFLDNAKGALLLEPQRTNLVTNSNVFTNWTKQGNITVTANQVISPDGLQNASIIDFSNATLASNGLFIFAGTPSASVSRTIYLKGANGGETLQISDPNQGGGLTVTLTTEWQRFEFTGGSASLCGIWLKNSVGNVIHAYGTQIEVGSHPTSFIPTQGTAQTRLGDVCNQNGISQVINSTEGVLYIETHNVLSGYDNNIYLTDGTNNERVGILFSNSSGNLVFQIRVNGVYIASITISANQVNWEQTNKIAIKYKTNDMSFWLNGTKVATDTSGTMFSPNTLTQLGFNSGSGGTFYGETRDLRVYNTALSDSELAALTTI